MKKFLLLILSISLFTACSDDDDNVANDGSEIVGKWYLVSVSAVGGNNLLTECNMDSFIEFNADGTAESEFYEGSTGNCTLENDDSGNWEYGGGNTYTFYVPYLDEDATGTVNFTGENQFTFTTPELPGVQIVFEK